MATAAPTRLHRILPHLAWLFFFAPNLVAGLSLKYSLQTLLGAVLFAPLLMVKPLRWLSLVALTLLGAINLVHIAFFGELADEFFLATALRTTSAETGEFLQVVPLSAWLSVALWLVTCGILGRYLWRAFASPAIRRSWWPAWLLAGGIWLVFLGQSLHQSYSLYTFTHKAKRLYPMHLAYALMRQHELRNELFTSPQLPTTAPQTGQQVDTIVVVLGESASAQRWSRLGYTGADTNAPLAGIAQLHTQTVLAQGTNTAAALPFVLTGQSALDSVQSQSPSFIDLAQAAGYKTFVLSNSLFSNTTEDFFSLALKRSTSVYEQVAKAKDDARLGPRLQHALADPAPHKLIVLHTWGSHPMIDKRTPKTQRHYADPYDNSMRYTSQLLAKWIQLTEQATPDRSALLLYTSDHGVMLPPCGNYRHGNNLSTLEVPLLTWINPYLAQNSQRLPPTLQADKLAAPREHSNALLAEIVIHAVGWSDWLASPNWHSSQAPKFNGMTWAQLRQRPACGF